MNEVAEKKKTIHQGKNVKIAREFKGLYQKDLADKLNKQQSDISKIESQDVIEDDLLEQIALALDVPVDFLKNFDFESAAKTFYTNNNATINSAENSQDTVNQVGEQNYYFSVDEFTELNDKFLKLQKELLEEKHQLDKEYALLKRELELLKGKK